MLATLTLFVLIPLAALAFTGLIWLTVAVIHDGCAGAPCAVRANAPRAS